MSSTENTLTFGTAWDCAPAPESAANVSIQKEYGIETPIYNVYDYELGTLTAVADPLKKLNL